jgi:peptide/nickel transport system permease protein
MTTHINAKFLKHNFALVLGGVIILLVLVLAFFPGSIASQDPSMQNADAMLKPPSPEHLFGTDNLGRDLFARVIYGARVDLTIGVLAVLVPLVFGSLVGLAAGYYGGLLDSILMRILDIFLAFPFTLVVIVVVTITGPGVANLYIAMWLVGWKAYARLVRSEVLVVKNAEYVQAAKVLGFSNLRLMMRHVLMNSIGGCVVYAASDIVMCMLAGASMSFLGLGVQPPTPEWGAIIQSGQPFLANAWWITAFPGLFLAVTGAGFSLLGDGLSDLLRTKGR